MDGKLSKNSVLWCFLQIADNKKGHEDKKNTKNNVKRENTRKKISQLPFSQTLKHDIEFLFPQFSFLNILISLLRTYMKKYRMPYFIF